MIFFIGRNLTENCFNSAAGTVIAEDELSAVESVAFVNKFADTVNFGAFVGGFESEPVDGFGIFCHIRIEISDGVEVTVSYHFEVFGRDIFEFFRTLNVEFQRQDHRVENFVNILGISAFITAGEISGILSQFFDQLCFGDFVFCKISNAK